MFKIIGSCLIAVLLAGCASAQSQRTQPAASELVYSQPALDQMLAPIALYPDPLLSQILMAATYPLEVVQAARWSDAHPELQGDSAVRAVENADWDPSVKSLVAFPRVLAMMDERIDWTEQLGEAFLVQKAQVLETVQALRQRAYAAGTLRSSPDTRVTRDGNVFAIDPIIPHVVYVPYYDPWVVYGAWWWPTHPPVVWVPWPGYGRPGLSVAIQWGGGIRLSAGFFFGAFDWHRHRVNVVHITNYYYRPKVVHGASVQWRHEPVHRRGHAYRHAELKTRYSQPAPHAVPRKAERHTAPRVHKVTTRRTEQRPVPRTTQRRDAHNAPRAPIVTKPGREPQPKTRTAKRRETAKAHSAPRAPIATQRSPKRRAATRTAARRDRSSAPAAERPKQRPVPHKTRQRDAPSAPKVTRLEKRPAQRKAQRREAPGAPNATKPQPEQQPALQNEAQSAPDAPRPKPGKQSAPRREPSRPVARAEKR